MVDDDDDDHGTSPVTVFNIRSSREIQHCVFRSELPARSEGLRFFKGEISECLHSRQLCSYPALNDCVGSLWWVGSHCSTSIDWIAAWLTICRGPTNPSLGKIGRGDFFGFVLAHFLHEITG